MQTKINLIFRYINISKSEEALLNKWAHVSSCKTLLFLFNLFHYVWASSIISTREYKKYIV